MILTIETFKKIGQRLKKEILPIVGTKEACKVIKIGASGDQTTYLDQVAEDIIIDELKKLHERGHDFTIYSEEVGIKKMGESHNRVVIDPIDGSLNAKRGLPFFSTSLAYVTGDTLGFTEFGYVLNLSNGDEFYAIKNKGAYYNDTLIKTDDDEKLYVLGSELSPRIGNILSRSSGAIENIQKVRVLGSIALDLCYLATGALDAFIHLTGGSRPIDFAAGKLILEEAGGIVTDAQGKSIDACTADLSRQTDIVAAKNKAIHKKILSLIS